MLSVSSTPSWQWCLGLVDGCRFREVFSVLDTRTTFFKRPTWIFVALASRSLDILRVWVRTPLILADGHGRIPAGIGAPDTFTQCELDSPTDARRTGRRNAWLTDATRKRLGATLDVFEERVEEDDEGGQHR